MELQDQLNEFEAAGISVYALSYDEVDALADFRDAYDIGYPLLSDPDSEVIRQFGILNTLIDENDHPWFGIPFPGTYVVDADGRITHKFFEHNLLLRTGVEVLLRAAKGEMVEPSNVAYQAPAETRWKVALDGDKLAVGIVKELVARIEVPEGRHLYADPAPTGNVAATFVLDENPQLIVRDVEKPRSHSMTLAGTGEVIEVYEGAVELRIPLSVNANLAEVYTDTREIRLTGELRWQTCDDHSCDLPRRERFEVVVPLFNSVVSELAAPADGKLVRGMNGMRHFERMASRRATNDDS